MKKRILALALTTVMALSTLVGVLVAHKMTIEPVAEETAMVVDEEPSRVVLAVNYTQEDLDRVAKEAFDIINKVRKENGRSPFKWGDDTISKIRANEITEIFSHYSESGISDQIGENCARTNTLNAQHVVELWMYSAGHRAAILDYYDAGSNLSSIAVVQKDGKYYWVENFYTPKTYEKRLYEYEQTYGEIKKKEETNPQPISVTAEVKPEEQTQEVKPEVKPEEQKPATTPEAKPEEQKPATTPETKQEEQKLVTTPEVKQEVKQEEQIPASTPEVKQPKTKQEDLNSAPSTTPSASNPSGSQPSNEDEYNNSEESYEAQADDECPFASIIRNREDVRDEWKGSMYYDGRDDEEYIQLMTGAPLDSDVAWVLYRANVPQAKGFRFWWNDSLKAPDEMIDFDGYNITAGEAARILELDFQLRQEHQRRTNSPQYDERKIRRQTLELLGYI